jgi:hypothetical protein
VRVLLWREVSEPSPSRGARAAVPASAARVAPPVLPAFRLPAWR